MTEATFRLRYDGGQATDHRIDMRNLGKSLNRHYRIGDVAPRHFVQSGVSAGLTPETILSLLQDLTENGPPALDETLGALPEGFPASISDPIAEGFRTRLGTIGRFLEARQGHDANDAEDD